MASLAELIRDAAAAHSGAVVEQTGDERPVFVASTDRTLPTVAAVASARLHHCSSAYASLGELHANVQATC